MLINWETLPALICLWLAGLILVQYSKFFGKPEILLSSLYFALLGMPLFFEDTAIKALLRLVASSTLLSLTVMNVSRDENPLVKKVSLKLFVAFILMALYFRENIRVMMGIEGVIALLIGFLFWKFKEFQRLRLRYFIKIFFLGFLFILLRKSSSFWFIQFLAMSVKLLALYYIYCLINTFAAEFFLKKRQV